MRAAYVIGCLNEEEHIGPLLDSLARQDHRPLEVIVVDGGSRDQTRAIVASHIAALAERGIELKLIEESAHGTLRSPANARNLGVRATKADALLLIDADFFMVQDDFTARVVSFLQHHRNATVDVTFSQATPVARSLALTQPPIAAVGYRREVFENELFDPSLGYGEDEDFWTRSGTNLALRCDATIGRHTPQSWREVYAQLRWYGRTLLPFVRKMRDAIPREMRVDLYRRHIWNRIPRALFYVFGPAAILGLLLLGQPLGALVLAALYALVLAKNYRDWPARGRIPRAFAMMTTEYLVTSAGLLVGLARGVWQSVVRQQRPGRD